MELLQAIATRRSNREYANQPVEDEDIEVMLRAAMQAPSAGDARPWRFVVIRQRHILDEIAAKHSAASMLLTAPLAILICADVSRARADRWLLDCAAATQNMLLAAHDRGLGAVWVGVQPVAERVALLRQVTNLPDNIQPVSLVAAGWPAVEIEQEDRYDPALVHEDHW